MSKYLTIDPTDLAEAFRALGNPQRLRLFLKLAACCRTGDVCCDVDSERRCVGEIGDDLGVSASTVSHHLKELRQAGLIHMERQGRNIQCWVEPATMRKLASFFSHDEKGTES
ncbi:MAG: hypothetical protein DHS20C21_12770 [Gemmatimonadota bacterium]|nr:MAG: hypothetical protein DHS20C21_12770 [Gemmatimonadota bacterium]